MLSDRKAFAVYGKMKDMIVSKPYLVNPAEAQEQEWMLSIWQRKCELKDCWTLQEHLIELLSSFH